MAIKPRLTPKFGGGPRIIPGVEAAGQSFEAGEFVYMHATTGVVTAYATDGLFIAGLAETAASGVTAAVINVIAIGQDDELILPTTTGGTAYAASSFIVGENYSSYVASNVHYADFADTTFEIFTCRGYVPTLDDSTSYQGRFSVVPSVLQFPGG